MLVDETVGKECGSNMHEQLFIWGVSWVTKQKQLRGRLDNYIITASVCMHMCM